MASSLAVRALWPDAMQGAGGCRLAGRRAPLVRSVSEAVIEWQV
jgi:hypothetical protein